MAEEVVMMMRMPRLLFLCADNRKRVLVQGLQGRKGNCFCVLLAACLVCDV